MTKIVLCGALFSLISLSAQDPAAIDKKLAEAKMQNDVIQVLGASMINGPTVKGAPYSAQVVNEMVQTLADGNRITTSHSSNLYRDSQGRERREESSSGSNPTVRSIFITDPVEGVNYTLMPKNKEAHKSGQRNVGFSYSTGGSGEGDGEWSGQLSVAVKEPNVVQRELLNFAAIEEPTKRGAALRGDAVVAPVGARCREYNY